jgi:hypothetical protein
MANPTNFSFEINQTSYPDPEPIALIDAWVYDDDGYSNLNRIDWWLYDQSTKTWTDLEDTDSFTPWSEDSNWASFEFTSSNLIRGVDDLSSYRYTLWGQAIDNNGNSSNSYSVDLILDLTNQDKFPVPFYFNADKSKYTIGETITVTGSNFDQFYIIDWWIKNIVTNSWTDINDSFFDPYFSYSNWNDFETTISIQNAGSYELWGEAIDSTGEGLG